MGLVSEDLRKGAQICLEQTLWKDSRIQPPLHILGLCSPYCLWLNTPVWCHAKTEVTLQVKFKQQQDLPCPPQEKSHHSPAIVAAHPPDTDVDDGLAVDEAVVQRVH